MLAKIKTIVSGFFLLVATTCVWGAESSPIWFSLEGNKQIKLRVDLFLSTTCPHCEKANEFFKTLESQGNLIVHRHWINTDKAALEAFSASLQQQKSSDFSVPAMFFCNTHWVGFSDDGSTGTLLTKAINYCRQQIASSGKLTPGTSELLNQWASANLYKSSFVAISSPLTFTFLVGLIDAISPCSIFYIIALLSFAWISRTYTQRIVVGFVYLLALGFTHYIQQSYFTQLYQMTSLRVLASLVGLSLLGYLGTQILFNRKGAGEIDYLSISLAGLTALIVQSYQQTCTPNISLIFQEWLAAQQFTGVQHIFYSALYQIIYLLPLFLVVIALSVPKYVWLTKHKDFLQQFSLAALSIIALVQIVYPISFANAWFSFLVIIISLLITKWTISKA